jgi:hypothetical protein
MDSCLDFAPVSRQIQSVFGDCLLLALTYLRAVFLVSLGVYALTMKGHSSRPAASIIKVLGLLVLGWGLWEIFATTATLVRGLTEVDICLPQH